MGLSFTIAAGPLGSESRGIMTIFYCLRFDTPQTGGLGSRIYNPQEQDGPIIPPDTGLSESELELLYNLRFTADHFVLVPSPL
jgi:hypothetical protein